MKLISVDEITGNEIAAEDIRSDVDFIIIPKDTPLKTSYIPALKNLNIQTICVKNTEEKESNEDFKGMLFPKEMIDYYEEFLSNIVENGFAESDFSKIEVLAEKIVDFIKENPQLLVSMKMERNQSIFQHSVVVTILSVLIALKLDLTRSRMYQIAIACLVHDLGLLSMNFSVVGIKEEELSPERLEIYYNHPVSIRKKLDHIPWMTEDAKEIVLSHHERANGRGFPYKKKRQSIGCRIVQVSDAFDRMHIGLEEIKHTPEELYLFMESRKHCRFDNTIVEFLFQVIAK